MQVAGGSEIGKCASGFHCLKEERTCVAVWLGGYLREQDQAVLGLCVVCRIQRFNNRGMEELMRKQQVLFPDYSEAVTLFL